MELLDAEEVAGERPDLPRRPSGTAKYLAIELAMGPIAFGLKKPKVINERTR